MPYGKNSQGWTKRQGKTRRVGSLIVHTITPICQQNGFIQARILLEWDHIVTPQFAQFCTPLKVTFPLKQRSNGRLLLRATGSMALEISYLEPHILKSINQYFGYEAISKIHFSQDPLFQKAPLQKSSQKILRKPLSDELQSSLEIQVHSIEDDRLRAALLSLGVGISQAEGKS